MKLPYGAKASMLYRNLITCPAWEVPDFVTAKPQAMKTQRNGVGQGYLVSFQIPWAMQFMPHLIREPGIDIVSHTHSVRLKRIGSSRDGHSAKS